MVKWYCRVAHTCYFVLLGKYAPRMHCHATHLNTPPVKRKQSASQTKRILLPVDGSDTSLKAARYALRIAELLDADIMCIHVIAALPLLKGMNPALVALYFSRAEKHAKKWISDVKQIAKKERRT
ncbi:MAG TPA: universal stress protein [Nitrososphaera sp.]|nr:universal stress protein [Nitrososphaera sp.]